MSSISSITPAGRSGFIRCLIPWVALTVFVLAWLSPGRTTAAPALDDPRYRFEFEHVTLDDAMYRIARNTGRQMLFDSAVSVGVSINGSFESDRLWRLLDEMLHPAGLEASRMRTGAFHIRYRMRGTVAPVTPEKTRISHFTAICSFYSGNPGSVAEAGLVNPEGVLHVIDIRPGMGVSARIRDILYD